MMEVTLVERIVAIVGMGLWLIFPAGMMLSILHMHIEDKKHQVHEKPHFSGNTKDTYPLKDEVESKKAA